MNHSCIVLQLLLSTAAWSAVPLYPWNWNTIYGLRWHSNVLMVQISSCALQHAYACTLLVHMCAYVWTDNAQRAGVITSIHHAFSARAYHRYIVSRVLIKYRVLAVAWWAHCNVCWQNGVNVPLIFTHAHSCTLMHWFKSQNFAVDSVSLSQAFHVAIVKIAHSCVSYLVWVLVAEEKLLGMYMY